MFLGTYEQEQTELMRQSFDRHSVLFDIGANSGYYSLLASSLSRSVAHVLAFEPSPACLPFLHQHVAANRLTSVTIIEAAVGAAAGEAWFEDGTGTATGHIAEQGSHRVDVVTVDDSVKLHGLVPTHLKIDVEGAELQVLHGAAETLNRHRPEIFLSTHGQQIHADCCDFLRNIGYRLAPVRGNDLASTPEIHCLPDAERQPLAA